MFKFIVVVYMILDLCHSLWLEDQIKKVAKDHNIELKKYK